MSEKTIIRFVSAVLVVIAGLLLLDLLEMGFGVVVDGMLRDLLLVMLGATAMLVLVNDSQAM